MKTLIKNGIVVSSSLSEKKDLLIENGKICEEGSHNELLKQNGTYHMLFETQAKYYKNNLDKTEVAE